MKKSDRREEEPLQGWSTQKVVAVLAVVAGAAVAVLSAWWLFHVRPWNQEHFAEAGAFGDAFGPAVGLLSALALAAAVASVFMQRAELALQRLELAETREELRKQRQAAEKHAKRQKRANQLAAEANELERVRQRADLQRLMLDIDLAGVEAMDQEKVKRHAEWYRQLEMAQEQRREDADKPHLARRKLARLRNRVASVLEQDPLGGREDEDEAVLWGGEELRPKKSAKSRS